jgi:hypothetical protein
LIPNTMSDLPTISREDALLFELLMGPNIQANPIEQSTPPERVCSACGVVVSKWDSECPAVNREA